MLWQLCYHKSWSKRKRQMIQLDILYIVLKKAELVSKFFNHVTMKYERGFRILTLLWSDEYSSIPIDVCPLSSGKDELLTCSAKACDGRSLAERIRKQARQKVPDILLSVLKDAIKAGRKAK